MYETNGRRHAPTERFEYERRSWNLNSRYFQSKEAQYNTRARSECGALESIWRVTSTHANERHELSESEEINVSGDRFNRKFTTQKITDMSFAPSMTVATSRFRFVSFAAAPLLIYSLR